MKKIKHSLWLLSALVLSHASSNAQMSIPEAEDVYGGRINAISVISTGTDSSRIFISTESANTLFYADAYLPSGSSPIFNQFHALPGADATAGYGALINSIGAHQTSGKVYFLDEAVLLSTHPSSSTVNTVVNGVNSFTIKGSNLLYTSGNQFSWGILDASGDFVASANSPISNPTTFPMTKIVVSDVDGLIYLFEEGTSPKLYVSSDPYTSLSSSTTFTDISPVGLSSTKTWITVGIAPDGRLFINGSENIDQSVAYSDDKVNWTEFTTGTVGNSGPNFAFSGNASNYTVYFGSVYSDNNGVSGSWHKFGDVGGFDTHPNDGAVFADPTNSDVVYMTTDQGLGASNSKGVNIYEIDEGIEAVQVKDFDMTADKNTAWLASKSGIRQVTNYQTSPVWTNAMFPNTDGSPYYSVAMDPTNSTTVFAGNVRVYKTTDAGTNWVRAFSAEDPMYGFPANSMVKTIEVCQYNSNIIFAGYYLKDSGKGGLFYTMDGGTSWEQLFIEASSKGEDVDVNDIVFNVEGSDTVAYIGVEYDAADPQGLSVYRIVKTGSSWTVAQDFDGTHTSVGYQITATINDLYRSQTGDTLFACGTDAGTNHPIAYVKTLSGSGLWTTLTTNGFPFATGSVGKAITLGRDTAYCAVDNEIYYLTPGASSWNLGYTYPEGNEINFLYYDELLVGAGTGLYGQAVDGSVTNTIQKDVVVNENVKIYPNPIKKSATITYTVKSNEKVSLSIVDVMGREVQTLVNEQKSAGTYKVHITTEKLAKGMYVIKLQTGTVVSIQDIIVE